MPKRMGSRGMSGPAKINSNLSQAMQLQNEEYADVV